MQDFAKSRKGATVAPCLNQAGYPLANLHRASLRGERYSPRSAERLR